MAEYEYKFIRVKGKRGLLTIDVADTAEYQNVIHRQAAEGWRFVQIFAPANEALGCACDADLIFERQQDG